MFSESEKVGRIEVTFALTKPVLYSDSNHLTVPTRVVYDSRSGQVPYYKIPMLTIMTL